MNVKSYKDESLLRQGGAKVSHRFYTRIGGVSGSPYESLNCGTGSNDDPVNVLQNRGRVADDFGVAHDHLLSVYQIHGSIVHRVGSVWDECPHGDAMVTDKPGIALGILTADCAPVLFSGQKADGSPVVGAAHAGWKGALTGVLDNVVSEMVKLGANANTIHACVGPCIAQESYEVSNTFKEPFLDENDESVRFFVGGSREGHSFFDLNGYCLWRLMRLGLENVSSIGIDTYMNEAEFFSYRRATHRNERDYGRQISVIVINSHE